MLESILSGTAGETLSLAMAALIILSALIMGLVISLVYLATHREWRRIRRALSSRL